MRETAVCYRCRDDDGPGAAPSIFNLPSTTARWFVGKCPRGHEVGVILQASGWARLFERALRRVAAGMPRDAVLDAYTAFEMYLAEVPARARYDRELGAKPRALRDELKRATMTSDRAIAAALAVVSLTSGKPPPSWNDEYMAKVRNGAIHSGLYPTEAQALKLCTEVARVIEEFEVLLAVRPCEAASERGSWHRALWLEEAADFRAKHPDINPSFSSGGVTFDDGIVGAARLRQPIPESIEEYRHLGVPTDRI